ncbi:MAG: hypothetical protein LBC61_04105, partial [Candidatus Peribacteria bacterium]|nr:hypothetical protein [Candidatus Peribacteria bacterium]
TSNDNQIATTSFVQAAVTTAVNTAVNNVLSSISTGGGGSGGSPASLKAPFICNARSWISL